MKKLSLHQAVACRDHDRIREIAAAGRHPLTIIEQCIEVRGDSIDTLMKHVSHDCPESVRAVTKVIAHLRIIGRYTHALQVLQDWLAASEPSNPDEQQSSKVTGAR